MNTPIFQDSFYKAGLAALFLLTAGFYSNPALAWEEDAINFQIGVMGLTDHSFQYDTALTPDTTPGPNHTPIYDTHEFDDEAYGVDVRMTIPFNEYFALETGFFFVPNVDADVTYMDPDSRRDEIEAKAEVDFIGAPLAIVFRVPLFGDFSAFGRAGGFYGGKFGDFGRETDTRKQDIEDTGIEVLYGGGLEYELNPAFAIVAEYTHYENVGQGISIGFRFDFLPGGWEDWIDPMRYEGLSN